MVNPACLSQDQHQHLNGRSRQARSRWLPNLRWPPAQRLHGRNALAGCLQFSTHPEFRNKHHPCFRTGLHETRMNQTCMRVRQPANRGHQPCRLSDRSPISPFPCNYSPARLGGVLPWARRHRRDGAPRPFTPMLHSCHPSLRRARAQGPARPSLRALLCPITGEHRLRDRARISQIMI